MQKIQLLKNLTIALLYIVCLQPVRLGPEAFNYYIIWNTGYGQWHTLIYNHSCVHIDLGGERLRLNSQLLALCQIFPNTVIFTHLDRHHLNLSWFYKKWLNPSCPNLWKEFKTHKTFTHLYSTPYCKVKTQASASLLDSKFWIGGHTLAPLQPHQILSLSQHGSLFNKDLRQSWLNHTRSAHMLISSKQLRRSQHHLKTEIWFKQQGRKLVYSYKWGHLIFHLP